MKRAAALACLPFVAFIATASFAQDKPLFVYVSPNPIGVNDFLKLGKVGTERVALEFGGQAKTYELRSYDAAPKSRGGWQGWRQGRSLGRFRVQ
jgi:hypothetical protein